MVALSRRNLLFQLVILGVVVSSVSGIIERHHHVPTEEGLVNELEGSPFTTPDFEKSPFTKPVKGKRGHQTHAFERPKHFHDSEKSLKKKGKATLHEHPFEPKPVKLVSEGGGGKKAKRTKKEKEHEPKIKAPKEKTEASEREKKPKPGRGHKPVPPLETETLTGPKKKPHLREEKTSHSLKSKEAPDGNEKVHSKKGRNKESAKTSASVLETDEGDLTTVESTLDVPQYALVGRSLPVLAFKYTTTSKKLPSELDYMELARVTKDLLHGMYEKMFSGLEEVAYEHVELHYYSVLTPRLVSFAFTIFFRDSNETIVPTDRQVEVVTQGGLETTSSFFKIYLQALRKVPFGVFATTTYFRFVSDEDTLQQMQDEYLLEGIVEDEDDIPLIQDDEAGLIPPVLFTVLCVFIIVAVWSCCRRRRRRRMKEGTRRKEAHQRAEQDGQDDESETEAVSDYRTSLFTGHHFDPSVDQDFVEDRSMQDELEAIMNTLELEDVSLVDEDVEAQIADSVSQEYGEYEPDDMIVYGEYDPDEMVASTASRESQPVAVQSAVAPVSAIPTVKTETEGSTQAGEFAVQSISERFKALQQRFQKGAEKQPQAPGLRVEDLAAKKPSPRQMEPAPTPDSEPLRKNTVTTETQPQVNMASPPSSELAAKKPSPSQMEPAPTLNSVPLRKNTATSEAQPQVNTASPNSVESGSTESTSTVSGPSSRQQKVGGSPPRWMQKSQSDLDNANRADPPSDQPLPSNTAISGKPVWAVRNVLKPTATSKQWLETNSPEAIESEAEVDTEPEPEPEPKESRDNVSSAQPRVSSAPDQSSELSIALSGRRELDGTNEPGQSTLQASETADERMRIMPSKKKETPSTEASNEVAKEAVKEVEPEKSSSPTEMTKSEPSKKIVAPSSKKDEMAKKSPFLVEWQKKFEQKTSGKNIRAQDAPSISSRSPKKETENVVVEIVKPDPSTEQYNETKQAEPKSMNGESESPRIQLGQSGGNGSSNLERDKEFPYTLLALPKRPINKGEIVTVDNGEPGQFAERRRDPAPAPTVVEPSTVNDTDDEVVIQAEESECETADRTPCTGSSTTAEEAPADPPTLKPEETAPPGRDIVPEPTRKDIVRAATERLEANWEAPPKTVLAVSKDVDRETPSSSTPVDDNTLTTEPSGTVSEQALHGDQPESAGGQDNVIDSELNTAEEETITSAKPSWLTKASSIGVEDKATTVDPDTNTSDPSPPSDSNASAMPEWMTKFRQMGLQEPDEY